MALSGGVWGIDIGQCALKALRCTAGPGNTIVADAFDYIEYPKILNQPEADPKAMVQEALTQFLSRNKVKGDKVAMSVSGQSGLARFFKPPPVDAKKMPDLVKFEARQQIPFALEDVIWDWQTMGGGTEVDGFALDTEVGLFAMKRDAVFRALEPFDKAEIEVDIVQLSPEAIYNLVSHDIITDGPAADEYDSENPPPSLAVLSMGTDTSDLVVTNGFRLWQRSIPLGGNHFTKQLSKELKLTFAKAEHLKRNARQAEDPKAIFQAMRSVFNDLVTEVQRSLQFFQGVDRKAKIKGLVLLGNAVRLPGLNQYLAKNLGLEVVNFDSFNQLTGAGVVASPSFKDNMLSFAVSYGLCLQGLGLGKLKTNLVPRELITERMIKAKKPWALASYAGLLLACSFNFFFHYNAWSKVRPETWNGVIGQANAAQSTSTKYKDDFKNRKSELDKVRAVGEELIGHVDRRMLWLELLKTITYSLPRTEGIPAGTTPDHKSFPIDKRKEIHIEYVESEYFPDLAVWWANEEVKRLYAEERRLMEAAAPAVDPAAAPANPQNPMQPMPATTPPAQPAPGATAAQPAATPQPGATPAEDPGPTGSGWVIEIRGHHYYQNSNASEGSINHVRKTLMKNLAEGTIILPVAYATGDAAGDTAKTETFTTKELGIGYVIKIQDEIERYFRIVNEDFVDPNSGDTTFGGTQVDPGKKKTDDKAPKEEPFWQVPKCTFTIQFVWQEKYLRQRILDREQRALEAQKAAEAAAAAGTAVPGVTPPVGPAPPVNPAPAPAPPPATN